MRKRADFWRLCIDRPGYCADEGRFSRWSVAIEAAFALAMAGEYPGTVIALYRERELHGRWELTPRGWLPGLPGVRVGGAPLYEAPRTDPATGTGTGF